MQNPKFPRDYTAVDPEPVNLDWFNPQTPYVRDTKNRLVQMLPGYAMNFYSNEPGSTYISQNSSDSSGGPITNPATLKTGSLYAETVITVGSTIRIDATTPAISVGSNPAVSGYSIILKDDFLGGFNGTALRFGFFLNSYGGGLDAGDFFVGQLAGNYIKWDDSAGILYVNGNITAISGTIGGWTIRTNDLYYEWSSGGIYRRTGLYPSTYPFYANVQLNWAGGDPVWGTEVFSVTKDGYLYAISGNIAGFNMQVIDASRKRLWCGSGSAFTAIQSTTVLGGDFSFWTGAVDPSSAPWFVLNNGYMRSDYGWIAGWTFNGGEFWSGAGASRAGMKPGSWPFYAGSDNPATAPFRVDNTGHIWATYLTLSGYLQVGQALGDAQTSLTAGGSIVLNQSSGGPYPGSAYLRWTGGSRIWSDTSNYMGINAIGGYIYMYCASDQNVVFRAYDQTIFYRGAKIESAFNVGTPNSTVVNSRFTGQVYFNSTTNNDAHIFGGTTTFESSTYYNSMSYDAAQAHNFFCGTIPSMRITSTGVTTTGYFYNKGTNYMWFKDFYLLLTSNKTAIVPTSKGFSALYCIESPEVWFMDFCDNADTVDPLFFEVTTGPYRFIRCENGGFQIWGKRKGHQNFRFETKTKAEFEANERFLRQNKPL